MSGIIYNAKVWKSSASETNTWVQFADGKVTGCGTDDDLPEIEQITNKYDAQGRWVFPGFHDCHMHAHFSGWVKNEASCLNLPKSLDEFKSTLRKLMTFEENRDSTCLEAFYWDDEIMGATPTRFDIDEVISDRPVVLTRVCFHVAVVNSKALELAGISKDTPELDVFPPGSEHAGELTGLLREENQISLIDSVLPERTNKKKKVNLMAALNLCLRNGITSTHIQEEQCYDALVELAEAKELPITCFLSCNNGDLLTPNCPKKAYESHYHLHCDFAKVFMDGALRDATAALSEPYVDSFSEGNKGMLLKTADQFAGIFDRVNKAGYRLEIHVIGDDAADVALQCLKKCKVSPKMRPIFVHCQILRKELITQMREQGVVGSVQPSFVPTDYSYVCRHLPKSLGSSIYPWKTLQTNGVVVGGSSDSPVETVNPFQGIYDAIFREDSRGNVLHAHECLTFVEAIDLYTKGSAYVDGVEDRKGQIRPGYDADFVIVDSPKDEQGNFVDLPANPRLLLQCKVHNVWVDGKVAFTNN